MVPIAREEFLPTLSAAVCDAFASCCAAAGHVTDAAQCRTNFANRYLEIYPEFGAPDLRADFDGMAAAECVDAMKTATRECRSTTVIERRPCNRLFRGQLSPGASCAFGVECIDPPGMGGVCPPVQGPSQRTCYAQSLGPLAEGDTCYGNSEDNPGGISSAGSMPCPARDNLRCDFDRNICIPLPRLGERCVWQRSTSTVYDVCVSGAYCDPISEVCIPQQTSGSCLVRVGDNPVQTRACAVGTFCDTNDYQCRLERPDGEACRDPKECSAHFCNSEQRCGMATALACEGYLL
jgi:hypothetical protein